MRFPKLLCIASVFSRLEFLLVFSTNFVQREVKHKRLRLCTRIFLDCRFKVDQLLVGGHNLLQLLDVGASQVGYLGLVLEEDEGRHGGDLTNKCPIILCREEPPL